MHLPNFHVVVTILSCVAAGCGEATVSTNGAAPVVSENGHSQMLKVLGEIRDAASVNHPYFTKSGVRAAQARLALMALCRGESCLFPIRAGGVHQHQQPALGAVGLLESLLDLHPDDLPAMWLLNIAHMTLGTFPEGVPGRWQIPEQRLKSAEPFPRFRNVVAEAGLDAFSLCGGSVADDFNGDGRLDVIVSDWDLAGQHRDFRNQGDGKFADETELSGLTGLFGGLNLIQPDYDNDGDLDLYVGNERFSSQLFENDGGGRFTDIAVQAGVTNGAVAKGVVWGDYNGDRYPDIYVSNIDRENCLYRNIGGTHFADLTTAGGFGHLQKRHGVSFASLLVARFMRRRRDRKRRRGSP